MIALFGFGGLTAHGRVSTNWIWMIELIPLRYKTIVGTVLGIFDGLIQILIAYYF
jgi:hypothetical protein